MARVKNQNVTTKREQLAEELKAAMKEKGISAPKVADDLNLSVHAVRAWMNGRFGPPDFARLAVLGKYFGREFLKEPVKAVESSNKGKSEVLLAISAAKQNLAAVCRVAEDAVDITIRW